MTRAKGHEAGTGDLRCDCGRVGEPLRRTTAEQCRQTRGHTTCNLRFNGGTRAFCAASKHGRRPFQQRCTSRYQIRHRHIGCGSACISRNIETHPGRSYAADSPIWIGTRRLSAPASTAFTPRCLMSIDHHWIRRSDTTCSPLTCGTRPRLGSLKGSPSITGQARRRDNCRRRHGIVDQPRCAFPAMQHLGTGAQDSSKQK